MKKQMKKKVRTFLALLAVMSMVLCNLTAFAEEPASQENNAAEVQGTLDLEPVNSEEPETPETEKPEESVVPEPTNPEESVAPETEKPGETTLPESVKPEEPETQKPVKPEEPVTPAEPRQLAEGKKVDVDPPVIEEVQFPNEKEIYKPGETIEVNVRAYDADSTVTKVEVQFDYRKNEDWTTSEIRNLKLTQDSQDPTLWKGNHKIIGSGHTEIQITGVTVVDANGYKTNHYENLPEYKIDVSNVKYPQISKFTISPNQQIVEDSFDIKVELAEEVSNINYISVIFKDSAYETRSFGLLQSAENPKIFLSQDNYLGTEEDRKYVFYDIEFYYSDDSFSFAQYDFNPSDYWFEVSKQGETGDTEKPIITNIEVDQNGKTLKANDKIQFRVTATDNDQLSEYGSLALETEAPVEDYHRYIELTLKDGVYVGEYTIPDDMPCTEWCVTDISVYDRSSNIADVTAFRKDFYTARPYYILVEKDGTIQIPSRDVTIIFYELDENGYYGVLKEYKKENVPTRTPIGEIIGGELPDREDYEGVKFEGWVNYDRMIVDSDTIMREEYISLYPQYEKLIVPVGMAYYNSETTQNHVKKFVKLEKDSTYKDLLDVLESEAKPEDLYNQSIFKGWKLVSASGQDLNTKIPAGYVGYATAQYEKVPVMASYYYINEQQGYSNVTKTYWADPSETYGAVVEKMKNWKPEDGWKEVTFEEWVPDDLGLDPQTLVSAINGQLRFAPKYDKRVMTVSYMYTNKRGERACTYDSYILKDTSTYKELQEQIEKKTVDMIDGIGFENWEVKFSDMEKNDLDAVVKGDVTQAYAYPITEKLVVRYVLDDRFRTGENLDRYLSGYEDVNIKWDTIVYKLVKSGDKVSTPQKIDGFKNVTWVYYPEFMMEDPGEYEVVRDITYYGYGEKDGTVPDPEPDPDPDEKPDPEPEKPKPEEPSKPSKPEGTPMPETQVDQVVDQIQNSTTAGETIKVPMQSATTVPKEILEEAKGKDVNVVLDMGDYSWTINGKDIKATKLKDINLEVKTNTNAIESSVVKQLAGDKPTKQLSLTHNGDFGFKADLTINVGAENSGQYGNLYYYDSSGKMVFISNNKIDANGNVSLSFSHASDYVIVMSKAPMSQKDVPDSLKPIEKDKSVKTGDNASTMMVVFVLLIIAAIGAVSIVIRARRKH